MTNIVKPSTLPGFLELLPEDQILFNKMMDIIRSNFEKSGFLPIDTPAIEKSEVLLAKGGGETEKQIYRFKKGDTDMSLRFDLTVPLARYTVEHFSDLNFPFRRYHIGKVYRGEKAQKGRFREFYQCDIDIIGNESLSFANDAIFPIVIYHTFKELGFSDFTIRINNRKLLKGFFKSLGVTDSVEVLRTIDKIDKIGEIAVLKELVDAGLTEEDANKILKFIRIEGDNDYILEELKSLDVSDETFVEGLNEISYVIDLIDASGIDKKNYNIDLKIARGLDYYTATVYETTLDNYPEIGSVCSGGRYDNLASYYTERKLPGVGLSIGLSRLFYQLREAGLIYREKSRYIDVLIIPMEGCLKEAFTLLEEFRLLGIRAISYNEDDKMKKKFRYADNINAPYVLILGEEEVRTKEYSLKDMNTGEQKKLSFEEVVSEVREDD